MSKIQKLAGVMALLLLLSAIPMLSGAAPVTAMGKLKTRNNKSILVNGQKSTTGSTIMSGVKIESPNGVGATVEIANVGRFDIAPNSSLSVNFDDEHIDINLDKGYVVLTTMKGINGKVITADGSVAKTDPSKLSSVAGRTADAASPNVAASGAGSRAGTGTIVGTLGAATAATGAIISGTRGRGQDVSPSRP